VESSTGLLYFAWFFGGLFGSPICAALINSEEGHSHYSYAIVYGGTLMILGGCLAWTVRVIRAGWNPLIKA
jgi:hypothetical protein